jgi:hypothetical protein
MWKTSYMSHYTPCSVALKEDRYFSKHFRHFRSKILIDWVPTKEIFIFDYFDVYKSTNLQANVPKF